MKLLRLLVPLLAALGASCASHNSHTIRLDPEGDLAPLTRKAFERMKADLDGELAAGDVAMAVDVDDVDVRWTIQDGDVAPADAVDSEIVRRIVEQQFVERLGPALAAGDTPDSIDAAELRFNAWLLIDLRAMDAVTLQVACTLTHRDEPDRLLAVGESDLTTLDRLPCFGCREHWFRDRGTPLFERGPDGRRRGPHVYFFGWWGFGPSYGYYRHFSAPTYVKGSR